MKVPFPGCVLCFPAGLVRSVLAWMVFLSPAPVEQICLLSTVSACSSQMANLPSMVSVLDDFCNLSGGLGPLYFNQQTVAISVGKDHVGLKLSKH